MASKRMFSLTVIDTDAFLEMPCSAQALYFHLCMRADDDGFVGSPKIITRTVGASTDDLKLLMAKRFVLTFEDGVIVIKHWRMHNTLSVNRYKETAYLENKALLKIKDNKAYTFGDGKPIDDTRLVEMGKRQVDEQKTNNRRTIDEQKTNTDKNRIDKNRVDKNSIDKNSKGESEGKTKKNVVWFESEEVNKVFKEFLEMRKKIKSPMTEYAIKRMVNKVNKLSGSSDAVAVEILNKSIDCGWKDVYPLKNEKPINQKAQELEELNKMGFEWARGGSTDDY